MNNYDKNRVIDLNNRDEVLDNNNGQTDGREAGYFEGAQNMTRESDHAEEKMNDIESAAVQSSKAQEEKVSPIREALSWVFTFAAAIVVALVLKNFVIINATVPTGSMENTIMPGDDLFGFRLAYQFSEPKRGDIVIFKYPDDEEEKYVKRIIGLPGEKVTIVNAKVYINDSETPLEEEYLKETWTVATGPFEFEVPENSYFVMGDNRNDSWDARYWDNTYVHKDKIIGKAEYIYFPFDRAGGLK